MWLTFNCCFHLFSYSLHPRSCLVHSFDDLSPLHVFVQLGYKWIPCNWITPIYVWLHPPHSENRKCCITRLSSCTPIPFPLHHISHSPHPLHLDLFLCPLFRQAAATSLHMRSTTIERAVSTADTRYREDACMNLNGYERTVLCRGGGRRPWSWHCCRCGGSAKGAGLGLLWFRSSVLLAWSICCYLWDRCWINRISFIDWVV